MLIACCASGTLPQGWESDKAIACINRHGSQEYDPRILFSLGMAFVQQGKIPDCTGKA